VPDRLNGVASRRFLNAPYDRDRDPFLAALEIADPLAAELGCGFGVLREAVDFEFEDAARVVVPGADGGFMLARFGLVGQIANARHCPHNGIISQAATTRPAAGPPGQWFKPPGAQG
jgi:hypothetical protein